MKRRRRLILALAAAALSLGVASAAGIDNLLWDGANTRAVIQTISDPLSVLDARSPGARRADALRQTKPGHTRSLAAIAPPPGGPEERVLASVRERPPEPDLAQAPPLLAPNSLSRPDALPDAVPTQGGPAGAGPGVGPAPFTPSNFGALPPPGGLLLPPNPSSPPGGTTPPGGTPPGGGPPGGGPPGGGPPGGGPPGGGGPVPEPASWAMMIMAMFAVGAALRRRRRHGPVHA